MQLSPPTLANPPRTLNTEEALLATPGDVPAATVLCGHTHAGYPVTEGPVMDLDALPPGQVIDAAVDRLLRLRCGEQVELRSGSDPHRVWREMDGLSPGGYGFVYQRDGPDLWRVQVTRRPAA